MSSRSGRGARQLAPLAATVVAGLGRMLLESKQARTQLLDHHADGGRQHSNLRGLVRRDGLSDLLLDANSESQAASTCGGQLPLIPSELAVGRGQLSADTVAAEAVGVEKPRPSLRMAPALQESKLLLAATWG